MAAPSKYKPEYNAQVIKLCKLGATDKDLASFFNVCERTLNNWKLDSPELLQSLKEGKEEADNNVAESLYKRAMGYEHTAVHISNYKGAITQTPFTKHYAPDATSMIFWLKNRRPDLWRDKQEIEHSGEVNAVINIGDPDTND